MATDDWEECRARLSRMVSTLRTAGFLWDWKRGEEFEPIFLPAVVRDVEMRKIAEFNPLRAARPMPSISIPRVRRSNVASLTAKASRPILRMIYPEIGVIDGGADLRHSHLTGWVTNTDITTEQVNEFFLEHGTAVCGAALYGSFNPELMEQEPPFKVGRLGCSRFHRMSVGI